MKAILAVILLISSIAVHAGVEAPSIVTEGLNAYFTPGRSAAVDLWLRNSPLADERGAAGKINDGLARIEREFGRMIGSEPIRVVPMAPSLRRVYVLLKFEKGPAYGVFDCYRAEKDWVVSSMDFSSKSAVILPSNLLGEDRQ